MSLGGRISIDAVLHEAPGSHVIRVHSIECNQEIASGKAHTFRGTCGTSVVTLPHANIPDPDFPGSTITFATITRVVMKASSLCELSDQDNHFKICAGPEGGASSHHVATAKNLTIQTVAGTASYEVMIVGT